MSSVTFNDHEIAYVAGALAQSLPRADSDFSVMDELLQRALDQLREPIDPDVAAEIARLREWGRRKSQRKTAGLTR